ncbi:MAG: hypothetical protein AB1508_05395 [Pseudomonadota bacterium]
MQFDDAAVKALFVIDRQKEGLINSMDEKNRFAGLRNEKERPTRGGSPNVKNMRKKRIAPAVIAQQPAVDAVGKHLRLHPRK